MTHLHIWDLLFNARGGWVYYCRCGAYRNIDGRVSAAPASAPSESS